MKTTLTNTHLSVTVNNHGAELCSLSDSTGTEYLWQGDPAIWNGQAPVLFPIVGSLVDNTYHWQDKPYSLPQHGFARGMDFILHEQTDTTLTYRLTPTQETRACYPFEFIFDVRFELVDNTLAIAYITTNTGDTEMPFCVGAHPGFGFSWGETDTLEDYYLEFDSPQTIRTHRLTADKLLDNRTESVLDNSAVIQMRHDLFAHDALILLEDHPKRLTLRSHKHQNQLSVDFPDFPHLGIWAKPNAPYVCIEPWQGYVDPATHNQDITTKPGIILLPPSASDTHTHVITITQ